MSSLSSSEIRRPGRGATRVLSVDPGLTRCGLAIVDGGPGRSVRPVAVDVARSSSDAPIEQRLHAIAAAADTLFERFAPTEVAVERAFTQRNLSTVMGTMMAAGVVAERAAQRGLPVSFYTPSEVKAAVTGHGRAEKKQVTTMVTKILGLVTAPTPADAADALAIGICHLWRAPLRDLTASAGTVTP